MKSGVRALGVAESHGDDTGTLAGAVVRADRVVDGLAFGTCTVGGTDATESVASLIDRIDRPDARYLLVAGIAPAWFNLLDLHALNDAFDRPVLSVTTGESPGLAGPIRAAFEGPARSRRLAVYRAQPDRRPVSVAGRRFFVRSVGLEADPAPILRAFTPEEGRPEPLRVARLAARGAERFRRRRE